MTDFLPLALAVGLVYAAVNTAKLATNRKWSALLTQLITWTAGVAVVLLLAHTDFAADVEIGAYRLGALNVWSQVFLGLTVGSWGSVVYDIRRSLDNGDSAATPALIPPKT